MTTAVMRVTTGHADNEGADHPGSGHSAAGSVDDTVRAGGG